MSLILLRHATQKPPVGPLKLDSGHPLAQGLVGGWIFNDYGNTAVYNPINAKDVLTVRSAAAWTSSSASSGVMANAGGFGTSGLQLVAPSAQLKPSGIVSMFWYGTWLGPGSGAGTGNPRIASMEHNNANGSPFISYGWYRSASADATVGWNNGSLQTLVLSNAIDTANYGRTQSLALAMDGASMRGFVDGGFRAVSTVGVGAIQYATAQLIIGGDNAGGNTDYAGNLTSALYIWNRKLTDAEVAWLHAEPYAMFQTRPMQRWFRIAAAGTVSLSGAAGGSATAAANPILSLVGTAIGQTSTAGALAGSVTLAGSTGGQGASTSGIAVLVAANAATAATASASLSVGLTGVISAQSAASATTRLALAAAASAQPAVSGALTVNLVGAVVGQPVSAGTLSTATTVALSGNAVSQAVAAASISVALSGSVAAGAQTVSTLTLNLVGAAVGQATPTGLMGVVPLVGSVAAQATATATLTNLTVVLVGSAAGHAAAAAVISGLPPVLPRTPAGPVLTGTAVYTGGSPFQTFESGLFESALFDTGVPLDLVPASLTVTTSAVPRVGVAVATVAGTPIMVAPDIVVAGGE